jgi:transposase, IS30 family
MGYLQLTHGERYVIARMRARSKSLREISRCLGRSVSTISREVQRNACPYDGNYRAHKAHSRAMVRRSKTRKKSQYSLQEWAQVLEQLQRWWSPKQISGRRRLKKRRAISHETIYRYVRHDRNRGGQLWREMRIMSKVGRKRRGSPATRGRLVGKRPISERPPEVDAKEEIGHCEGDTVMGCDQRHCILTLVERVTGLVVIKKLTARTKEQASSALARAIIGLKGKIKTITLDNGTEFHDYESVEKQLGVKFYFARPYHSWERGANENTNGLIRQYLPKGMCMSSITQADCNRIAKELNDRPRERLGFRTPAEVFRRASGVALQS